MSRPNVYRQNRLAMWFYFENKNIQAFMTKQFIRSYSYSLLYLRNNDTVTQKQYMFVLWRN